MNRKFLWALLFSFWLFPVASVCLGGELLLEHCIESTPGAPITETYAFDATGYENLILQVVNGESDGSRRISSAMVSLNGIQIIGPADFNQKVGHLERALAGLEGTHHLTVNLRSNPGGFMTVRVLGDRLLNLPQDPGGTGDQTLEGVDVNGNGIRDDIELWIAQTYPDSEKTRQALIQYYYPLQGFIMHASVNDRDAVYDDMTALQRAGECMNFLFGEESFPMRKELKARILNTRSRGQAYLQASRLLGGGSFPARPLSKWKQSCTFNPDEFSN